ncbi:MAG: reprolysin-like metallopeptidase [Pyrinomonadaceae bacterium]
MDDTSRQASTVISLPNAEGNVELFEVFEASNFEPDLQAQFPEIRAFSGRGITDRYATLKLSISPQGIQTMVFRTDKDNEFIEPYSEDHKVYAVFKTHREKGGLPWACSTTDKNFFADWISDIYAKEPYAESPLSNAGQLKTMRLAQSTNAEYSNFFGATSAAQVSLVLAAINATLTRSNGVYEKDLAVHLNLIASTTAVIYYDPATDPYTAYNVGNGLDDWNAQLQATLTANIGEANYDIGHMFGRSGGGGNAGCIGCVCTNGSKGSGITSPADNIPMGDNFDIDYVVHEMGHQMGANHTFSFQLETGTGQNKEVGSGITIMGYAGITNRDVAPHSIDTFHETSIQQIQTNLAGKTCPTTTVMTANNPPVVAPVSNYTIPITTPFALTGSATDPEGDALTYQWEQNNNATTQGANSVASPTKLTGPNWLSFLPTSSPTRTFPRLSTILAGLAVTPVLTGGDAGTNIEALSSVSRTLNFRLTVRDNRPYVAGSTIGQTQFTDTTITVTNTAGPFQVTAQNSRQDSSLAPEAANWQAGTSQTVTWSVANTNLAPISTANVNILLSTDGGQTFPTVLAANTPNDGTQQIVVPNMPTTTARLKVEAVGNIYFDISNVNFTITAPTAAAVSVAGRVLVGKGTGLRNAVVILTDLSGNSRSAISSSFGYYRFDDVSIGETYFISVKSKRYSFETQTLFVTEDVENLNFTNLSSLGEIYGK